uniref:Uncharacterized protein n=1 Tax=Timema douglasi TaxID=61478 RepID=A0A7R8VE43_TIMDO|nr:unnamed protein product [Timema douglasi]
MREANPHIHGGRVENHFRKSSFPNSLGRDLNLNLPILGSLAQHQTSALANYATEAGEYKLQTGPPLGVCKRCGRTGLCDLGGWAPCFLIHVLERAVTQKLSTHKMKSLFKKFLSFEETHGTPELVTNVRQLALNYVEASTGT